jgi:hypothetical protein
VSLLDIQSVWWPEGSHSVVVHSLGTNCMPTYFINNAREYSKLHVYFSILFAYDVNHLSGIANDFQTVTLFYMQVITYSKDIHRDLETHSVSLWSILILSFHVHQCRKHSLTQRILNKIPVAFLISLIFSLLSLKGNVRLVRSPYCLSVCTP